MKRNTENCRLVVAVSLEGLASLLNSVGECAEDFFCILPVDAGIGDTDSMLEAGLAFGRNLLVA